MYHVDVEVGTELLEFVYTVDVDDERLELDETDEEVEEVQVLVELATDDELVDEELLVNDTVELVELRIELVVLELVAEVVVFPH